MLLEVFPCGMGWGVWPGQSQQWEGKAVLKLGTFQGGCCRVGQSPVGVRGSLLCPRTRREPNLCHHGRWGTPGTAEKRDSHTLAHFVSPWEALEQSWAVLRVPSRAPGRTPESRPLSALGPPGRQGALPGGSAARTHIRFPVQYKREAVPASFFLRARGGGSGGVIVPQPDRDRPPLFPAGSAESPASLRRRKAELVEAAPQPRLPTPCYGEVPSGPVPLPPGPGAERLRRENRAR